MNIEAGVRLKGDLYETKTETLAASYYCRYNLIYFRKGFFCTGTDRNRDFLSLLYRCLMGYHLESDHKYPAWSGF